MSESGNGAVAAASFALVLAMLQTLREKNFATTQEVVDLFDAALSIMEGTAASFPKGVQEGARRILAQMQDGFAKT